jgi:hypothetical protein
MTGYNIALSIASLGLIKINFRVDSCADRAAYANSANSRVQVNRSVRDPELESENRGRDGVPSIYAEGSTVNRDNSRARRYV